MHEPALHPVATRAAFRSPHLMSSGLTAAAASALALLWQGWRDNAHPAAPLNAVSHWWWPRRALRENAPSWRYTGNGLLVHVASSLWWAAIYTACRRMRKTPNAANAWVDAAAVGTGAALVDLRLVPERLSPGFERRLRPAGLIWVYAAFAVGLAIGGLVVERR